MFMWFWTISSLGAPEKSIGKSYARAYLFLEKTERTKTNNLLNLLTPDALQYRTAGHLVFWKPWPAVEQRKVKCHKTWFRLLSPAWTKRYILEIYKAFQDRLTFFNRHMIVWLSWIFLELWNLLKRQDCRSFSILKTLPVTGHIARPGHIATAFHKENTESLMYPVYSDTSYYASRCF